jgi:hypothetical protein
MALIAALLAAAAGWTASRSIDWIVPDAHGQQAGRQAGAPSGSSPGGAQAGYVGASNQGGAGGVSNPTPGADAGQFGGSAGEGRSANTKRAGYLGGRAAPDDGGGGGGGEGGGGTVTPYMAAPPTLEALAASCPYAEPIGIGPQGRIAGENVARLAAVGANLNPAADRAALQSSAALLAGYQEALADPKPDPMLAGTYLGLVAKEPVTADAVQHVSASLCVPVGIDQATAIAHIAEGQRQKLERDAQARVELKQ